MGERTPVWMMRQAGRHIKEYRDLVEKHPTFRERPETPDVAVEISLQPWRNYQTDGCILFSDILTPLPGMGVEFDIQEKVGPVIAEPVVTWDAVKKMHLIDPSTAAPFTGEALRAILKNLADSIAEYALYQIESGAQLMQIFDSWAGHLSPRDYDTFASPYRKMILDRIKEKYPDVPT